jgi:Zn-dependent protease with chaperone function
MARPLKPQPLWVRVDENRLKLVVFVAVFVVGSALLLTIAFVGVPGALIGAALAVLEESSTAHVARTFSLAFGGAFALLLFVGSIVSAVQLSNGEDWVRSRFKAAEIERGAEPALERVIEDMAIAAGLSTPPRLLLIEADSVNAGVVGLSRADAAFVVTRGLLARLSEGELRSTAAALMARVVSGDVLYGTALAALMGPLKALREWRQGTAAIGNAVGDGCAGDGCDGCGCLVEALGDADSPAGCGGAIALAVFAAVVIALTYAAVVSASWIVTIWGRALQRTSYEKADAEGMLLLKDPGPMLSALRTAITSSNLIADGDPSYDGVFYTATSGTPAIERVEQRRYDRLREVLGTDGLAAPLG